MADTRDIVAVRLNTSLVETDSVISDVLVPAPMLPAILRSMGDAGSVVAVTRAILPVTGRSALAAAVELFVARLIDPVSECSLIAVIAPVTVTAPGAAVKWRAMPIAGADVCVAAWMLPMMRCSTVRPIVLVVVAKASLTVRSITLDRSAVPVALDRLQVAAT